MEPYFEGGHSIVVSYVDPATRDLYVASRESGDILKVAAVEGEKPSFEVRLSRRRRRRHATALLLLRRLPA
eukprot:COSAG01_NODE_565_length_15436_cov_64.116581_14_plen_71_part_00